MRRNHAPKKDAVVAIRTDLDVLAARQLGRALAQRLGLTKIGIVGSEQFIEE